MEIFGDLMDFARNNLTKYFGENESISRKKEKRLYTTPPILNSKKVKRRLNSKKVKGRFGKT